MVRATARPNTRAAVPVTCPEGNDSDSSAPPTCCATGGRARPTATFTISHIAPASATVTITWVARSAERSRTHSTAALTAVQIPTHTGLNMAVSAETAAVTPDERCSTNHLHTARSVAAKGLWWETIVRPRSQTSSSSAVPAT